MFIARYHYDSKGNKIQFETRQQYENRLRELGFDDETIARYSYNRYNGKSDYEANRKEALENRLLDMYLAVITNANTFNEVRQPLDTVTDYLKNHILSVVDSLTQQSKASTSSPLYYVTPQFQSKTKAELSGGKRGIGPFALAASHHALTQQVGLTLANNKGSEILQRFGITNVSGIRSNQNNHAPGFEQVNTNILDWLSAMINAHVDVAKDPYIIRLNVRSLTYNMTNFLLRTGVGETTFYFLPQQILKDFAVEYDKYAGFYGVDLPAYANPESTAHRNVWNKYFEAANKLATTSTQKKKLADLKKNPSAFLSSELLDINWLMKQLNVKDEAYKSFNWYFNQLRVMKLYDAFTPSSRSLSALTTLSQIDTKKFGNNFGLESAFLVRWKNFVQTDGTFDNPLSMFTNTFLYQKLVNGMLFPRDAFKNVMLRLTPQFEIWRNKLHALTGTLGSSNNDTINSITRAMEAQYKSAFFDKYCKDHNINVDELLYGKNSIVNRFYTLRNRIVRGEYPTLLDSTGRLENALLNSLVPRQKYDALDAILPDFFELKFNKDGNDGMDDILIRAWEELADSEYADVREFARDLAIYSFYTSGDAFGRNNFFKYVPNSLRESLGYFDYIRNLESDPDNLSQFAQLTNPIFRNLWWNEDIVPTVEYVKPTTEFDKATGEIYQTDGKLPNQESGYTIQTDDGKYLDVPGIFMNTRRPRTIGFNEQGDTIYTPYVKIRLNGDLDPRYTMLYRFIGVAKDSQGNVEYPVYRLIPKFGVNMQGMTLLEFGKKTSSIGANNYYYKGSVDPTIFTDYRPIKDIAPTSLKNQVDVFSFLKDINTNPQQLAESSSTEQIDNTSDTEVNNADNAEVNEENNSIENKSEEVANITQPEATQESTQSEEVVQTTNDFDEFVRETSEHSNTAVLNQVREQIPQAVQLQKAKEDNGYAFTFNNGFKVSLPFTLNEQQEAALRELEAFVNDPASSQFTLSGYAGTGKTTVIGIFKQYLDNINQKVVFTAPTHRANAVTRAKTPGATVMTLAKLFGLSVDVDLSSNNYDLRTLQARQTNDPKLEGNELIIIDEASMVQDGMYELIQNQLSTYPGTKVIYVGDQGQLRPVKSDTISKVFTDADTPKMQLTKVERTGDNPILKESTRLRNGEGFSYETELVNGEGVTFTNDRTQIATWVKNALQSSNFAANKTYFKIVAGTNAAVEAWNRYARKVLFGTTEHYLTEGDLITGYNNALRDRFGEYQFINSMDYVVTAVRPTSLKYSLDGETVTLRALDVTLQNAFDSSVNPIRMSFAVPGQTQILTKMREYIDDMWSAYRAAKAKGDRQAARYALDKINSITNSLFLLENVKDSNGRLLFQKTADYGYAVTSHKCLSENSMIYTERGLVKLKDIQIGDCVNTGFGVYKKVLDKVYTGNKKVYKLTTRFGYELVATLDHRIMDSHLNMKPMKEFKIGEFLPISRNSINNKTVDIDNKSIDYLIGYIIGDGSYNIRSKSKSRIDITVGLQEQAALDIVLSILNENYIPYHVYTKKNAYQVVIENMSFRKRLLDLGLTYVSKADKDLPKYVYTASKQQKSDLLRGLFDSDGCAKKNTQITYVTMSKKLVMNIQKLLLEFGIISNFNKQRNAYYLDITGSSYDTYKEYINFLIPRKRERLSNHTSTIKTNVDNIPLKDLILLDEGVKNRGTYYLTKNKNVSYHRFNNYDFVNPILRNIQDNKYFFDKIVSIEEVGCENTYDLEIEDIHQFVADGFIVHNSQGGTFNNVLVDEKSIHAFRNAELEKELKYVAVSRASEDVMVIADKTHIESPITNKPMSNDFSSADQMASDEANALRGIQPNAEASARFQQSLANLGLTEEETS